MKTTPNQWNGWIGCEHSVEAYVQGTLTETCVRTIAIWAQTRGIKVFLAVKTTFKIFRPSGFQNVQTSCIGP